IRFLQTIVQALRLLIMKRQSRPFGEFHCTPVLGVLQCGPITTRSPAATEGLLRIAGMFGADRNTNHRLPQPARFVAFGPQQCVRGTGGAWPDSGPPWLANPLAYDSFTYYNVPAYPGARES